MIDPFLRPSLSEDAFQDLLLCCYEVYGSVKADDFSRLAQRKIKEMEKIRNIESRILYNSKRNVSLDCCYGSGKNSAHDWLKVPQLNERF